MDLEQFKRVEELFETAAELPPDRRAPYLDKACGGDRDLRQRVERLLAHDTREMVCDELDEARHFGGRVADMDNLTGSTIGPYEVGELLGEGGFGSVYLARQKVPVRRTVALKIIKLGMDTKQVIARFEAERQALALMDHPSIARVFDAGATATGRPYFVMEYVPGVPITRYCDERRLPLRARLELFVEVCLAVHHAHQKGVIHRDLKPSNILVRDEDRDAPPGLHHDEHDGPGANREIGAAAEVSIPPPAAHTPRRGAPLVRIIDFGIAKAAHGRLTDKTLFTELRQFIGTPQYMSPEQAALGGADLDTRSDIYSLGVLLYELLTGQTPFDAKQMREAARDELLKIIREQEPKKPSTHLSTLGHRLEEIARQRSTEPRLLRRTLRGDLDWIILKAMAKDRARRYDSAAELAHEIERSLHNRPIQARPPGAAYLARKFIRRHRMGVGAAAAVALALMAGFIAALVGLREARLANIEKQTVLDESRQRLWDSLVAQARAARNSDQIGRRSQALDAIARAAEIRPSATPRDEAIAAMALPDFEPVRTIDTGGLTSADGLLRVDRLAHSPFKGRVHVLSAIDGHVLAQLQGPPTRCWVILFSSDGGLVGAKFHDQTDEVSFMVWDVASETVVLEVSHGLTAWDNFSFCTYQGRPAVAIGGSGERIDVYDLLDGRLVHTLQTGRPAFRLVADPTGTLLACSDYDEREVTIWDIARAAAVRTIESTESIRTIAWSDDGTLLAGCGAEYSVFVWDAMTGATRHVLRGHEGVPVQAYFGPDASILATYGWDNTTRLWDLETGRAIVRPLPNTTVVGFSDYLVTGNWDRAMLWRREPALELRRIETGMSPGQLRFIHADPHGSGVVVTGDGGMHYLDPGVAASGAVDSEVEARGAMFAPDGSSVIVAVPDGVFLRPVAIADHTSVAADSIISLGEGERLLNAPGVRGMDLDAQSGRLALSLGDRVEIYDLASRELLHTQPGHSGLDRDVGISPGGRWLFMGNWRGPSGQLWDLEHGRMALEVEAIHVRGRFSPDGRWLIVSTGSTLQIYDLPSLRLHAERRRDNSDDLAGAIAFTPDGRQAALTHSRFEIQLVDIESTQILASFWSPEPTTIEALSIGNDGTALAALTASGDLLIWNLRLIREGLRGLGLDWDDAARTATPADPAAPLVPERRRD